MTLWNGLKGSTANRSRRSSTLSPAALKLRFAVRCSFYSTTLTSALIFGGRLGGIKFGRTQSRNRAGWRLRRRHARSGRTQSQLLQRWRIQSSRRIQSVRRLILFYSRHGRIVPFSIRTARVRPVFRQSGLNFGNTIVRGSLLSALPARTLRSFFANATGMCAARRRLFLRRVRLCGVSRHTQPCYQRQQQDWENYFSADHFHCFVIVSRFFVPESFFQNFRFQNY